MTQVQKKKGGNVFSVVEGGHWGKGTLTAKGKSGEKKGAICGEGIFSVKERWVK